MAVFARTQTLMPSRFPVALFCALSLESTALAQSVPDIAPGTRVRVQVGPDADSLQLIGRAMKVDSQHVELTVSDNGSVADIPWSHITRFGWSLGSDYGAGIRKAFLVSVPAGVAVYLIGHGQAQRRRMGGGIGDDLNEAGARLGAIVFTSLTFGAVATFAAPEGWQDARRPEPTGASARVRLHLAPTDEFRARTQTRTVTGRALSSEGDTLVLVRGTASTALLWQSVTSLAVRSGKDRGRGAFRGFMILSAISIVGLIMEPQPAGDITGFFIGNGIVGGILGALFAPRAWIPLPVANR